jgi:hypothetical protein
LFLNRVARQKIFQGEVQAGGQKGRGGWGKEFLPVLRFWVVGVHRFGEA